MSNRFPPAQLQDGKSPEWTCDRCGGDGLFCKCNTPMTEEELELIRLDAYGRPGYRSARGCDTRQAMRLLSEVYRLRDVASASPLPATKVAEKLYPEPKDDAFKTCPPWVNPASVDGQ